MNGGAAWHPQAEPFDRRRLRMDSRHTIYLEQFGRRDGVPAVFLHGGPGSGCQRAHARAFDPGVFRAVLFDQRGAGLSEPRLSLVDNDTPSLVADIERIREALGIERWLVVGGSWGSTLAVAYAERCPERALGLVLRAVFLGTAEEVDWAFRGAAQTFRPELWRRFVELLPEAERADPIASWGRRLESRNPAVHVPAAHALCGMALHPQRFFHGAGTAAARRRAAGRHTGDTRPGPLRSPVPAARGGAPGGGLGR